MSIVKRFLIVVASLFLFAAPGLAQQQVTASGKVLDPDGLALPGASITLTEQNTGVSRSVVTEENGTFSISNVQPGLYTLLVEMDGFAPQRRESMTLSAGAQLVLDLKMQLAGVAEQLTVTGEAPQISRTSNQIGGTLSGNEIDTVPANFRNIGALTSLVPGMTPNPAGSTFEGGQVVANGTPAQSNVYLIDGMYNNDDRLGGSQGTQVRVVLDNIDEYQVLANQYSAEYGGGAGAIINMVTRGGSNTFSGRGYAHFRDESFNARGHFLPDTSDKPEELTQQLGFAIGGPVIRNRAHFYFTIERDNEEAAGLKKFPPEAAPLATDFVGTFEVHATNYFARGDLQLNTSNFVNVRWVLEQAPTKGEGFNTNNATIDAQSWEGDWDNLFNVAYTSVISDRASNVVRVGRIGEQLQTGAQAFFDEDVSFIGFDGRDPFTMGQQNNHPGYVTGKGGTGANTRIRTMIIENSFSYFVPSMWGAEHTMKMGGNWSRNAAPDRAQPNSGTFTFSADAPYNPAVAATRPTQFTINVGPPDSDFAVTSIDKRGSFFFEDRMRLNDRLSVNAGLRFDYQTQTGGAGDDFSPRAGFAWDVFGTGGTVVRGGAGRFTAYMPNSVGLNIQTSGRSVLFPQITITTASDTCGCVLVPDMINDSQGNAGVAVLSAAGIRDLDARRTSLLAGGSFNQDPLYDDPDREMPFQYAWSAGVAHQLTPTTAVTVDYVGNASRDQNGQVDLNEPRLVSGVYGAPGAVYARPGIDVIDPNGELEALGTPARTASAFRRVLQYQSNPGFDGDYQSLQMSLNKRMANRWSGRVAYTLQKAHQNGLGSPDGRRIWVDNDITADYGLFASNRTNVFVASASVNVWRSLTVATVLSAIDGARINEVVGSDRNGDADTGNDRPIQGVDDIAAIPSGDPRIRSAVDSQGRAVINGLEGPGSMEVNMSIRYSIPLAGNSRSLDLFFDVFNLTNRENVVNPSGNRASSNFMVPTAANFARQSQFGFRVRF